MSTPFVHVVVAGNIGAGKTTLTRLLARRFGWQPYFERVDDNPFLEDFYADMERWAFALQIFFLTHRLDDQVGIAAAGRSVIQDRSIHEDALIFARNLREMGKMSEREWDTYRRLYEGALALLRPPDLVVYLRRSVEGLCRNIKLRGRDYESDIPTDYLARLNRYYEDWIASRPGGRLLVVDADNLDFLENPCDLDELITCIRDSFEQRDMFDMEPAVDSRFELILP